MKLSRTLELARVTSERRSDMLQRAVMPVQEDLGKLNDLQRAIESTRAQIDAAPSRLAKHEQALAESKAEYNAAKRELMEKQDTHRRGRMVEGRGEW